MTIIRALRIIVIILTLNHGINCIIIQFSVLPMVLNVTIISVIISIVKTFGCQITLQLPVLIS